MKKLILILLLALVVPVSSQKVTTDVGVSVIKHFEGVRLVTYRCPANVLTNGYGHTGPDVFEGMRITKQQAEINLRKDLRRFENYINRVIRRNLRWHEFDALSSFSFNLGYRLTGEFKSSIEFGNTIVVTTKMMNYSKAKVSGKYVVLKGLLKRRAAEASLYDGSYSDAVIKSILRGVK